MPSRLRSCSRLAARLTAAALPTAFAMLALTATAQTSPDQTPIQNNAITATTGPIIDHITIIGAKELAPTAILVMTGHQTGETADDKTVGDIKKSLIHTGLFGMHHPNDPEEWVRTRIETENSPQGHCDLIVIVDENEKIERASITGSGPIKPEEILAKLHLNNVYNSEQIKRDAKAIQTLYSVKGYIATIGSDLGPDEAHSGVLNFPIVVTRVHEIRLTGNKTTRSFIIRRELETREGGYYNRNVFNADLERLANLRLFKEVDPQETVVAPGQVDIALKITENKTGTYTGGASAGGGQLTGFVEVSQQNLLGLGASLGVHVESGLNTNTHTIDVNYIQPYIDRKNTTLSVNAYDKAVPTFSSNAVGASSGSASLDQYVQQRTGGVIGLNRNLNRNLSVGVSFRGESLRSSLNGLTAFNAALLQDGPVFSVGGVIARNTRDFDADPARGGLQALHVNIGHADLRAAVLPTETPAVFGSHNFAKSSIELTRYISLQGARRPGHPTEDKQTLAFRLLGGSSTGALPFTEQYFVGGGDSLRGYRDSRFWGQNMFLGSVELRQPLMRGFKGVLFADCGDAWGGAYRDVALQGLTQGGFKPHASAGLGVRVGTPFGQVRLDYGVGDEGGLIHFGIGHPF